MIKKILRIFSFFIILIIPLRAEEVRVFEFTNNELNELTVRKVRGANNKTNYSVGSNEDGNFLIAIADNAASGLGKKIKINLSITTSSLIQFNLS